MSPKREDPPSNLRSLTTRIDNLARERSRPVRRIQRVVANTVVGQMLPPGVVKGGTAMKTGRNERAHDLADLQILDREEHIDMAAVGVVGQRLFAARPHRALTLYRCCANEEDRSISVGRHLGRGGRLSVGKAKG